MSGGVPKRILITQTQRNTPSKAGNPVAKNAIILCNGGRSRAICNYLQRRAEPKASLPSVPDIPPQVWTYGALDNTNFKKAIDWWIEGGEYKAAVTDVLGLINSWDTSTITDMSSAFDNGRGRELPLGGLLDSTTFDDSISNWNTVAVTNMGEMFKGAAAFDKPLLHDVNKWNTTNVTSMREMFNGATSFDQDLSKWDISSITTSSNLEGCFNGATALNQTFYDSGEGTWFATAQNLALIMDITGFYTDGTNYHTGGVAGKQPTLKEGWSLYDVSGSGQMFTHSCIEAVDGKIYIIYTWSQDIYAKDPPYELHFVYSDDGGQTWSTPEVIDEDIASLRQNSMAVDAGGVIYVCYTKFGAFLNNPDLMWTKKNNVDVSFNTPSAQAFNIGDDSSPSIAVQQSTGTLFISYYNETTPGGSNGCLQTFRSENEGGTWATILADGGGTNGAAGSDNTGQHSSITTAQGSSSNNNYVYICYHRRTVDFALRLCRSDDDGATYTVFQNITLTNAQDTVLYPSIYVTDIVDDTNGKVYMSYNYATTIPSYVIYVASWTDNGAAGPQKTLITGAEGPSATAASTGVATVVAAYGSTVYVSYGYVETLVATERPLYLATSTDGGTTWNLEVIDSTPGGPAYAPIRYTPSMNMIDGNDNIVISYPGPGTHVDGYDVKMAKYS